MMILSQICLTRKYSLSKDTRKSGASDSMSLLTSRAGGVELYARVTLPIQKQGWAMRLLVNISSSEATVGVDTWLHRSFLYPWWIPQLQDVVLIRSQANVK